MDEKALEEKRIMHMVSQQHVERFKAEHHRFEVLSEVRRALFVCVISRFVVDSLFFKTHIATTTGVCGLCRDQHPPGKTLRVRRTLGNQRKDPFPFRIRRGFLLGDGRLRAMARRAKSLD
nr:hypothetical protein [Pandoravirus aubagnensis]